MRKFLLISILFLITKLCNAAYFENTPYTLTQPNGEIINCFVSGDEFFNWTHDAEGFTIIQAPDGYFYYAEQNGEFVKPSIYKVNSVNPATVGLTKWVKISEQEYQRRHDEMFSYQKKLKSGPVKAPHSGTLNNIVIYIRFSDDAEFTNTRQSYDDKFNPTTGNTLKSYYKEVSYGSFTISSTHYPACAFTTNLSYQDSHPRGYFQPLNVTTNPNGYNGSADRQYREHSLLVDAVNWINQNSPVPTSLNIDGDGDGRIDNVCFIIKGSSGAWAELLWAHRWSLFSQTAYINGKQVYDYTFQPESQVAVRTICHEMFHALGAPDLYHYTNQGVISPAGSWDLMESGGGHMLAYMKWRYSNHLWIPSIPQITTTGTYTLHPITSPTNNCYKIASPYSSNEFFMVEYRNKTGVLESNIPGSGLLVYRIDTTLNGNASGPPDGVYIYRPGGTLSVNGTVNDANFSANVGRTAINDTTNPNGFLQTGGIGGLKISNITTADTTISFNVTFPLPCTPPTIQASAFTSSAITTSSMTIGFTRGNGDSVLILARAYNPVSASPVNGTYYPSASSFGTGIQIGSGNYVVYKGTVNTVNLSSLSSGTTYYFAVFEFNATTKCYKTPAFTASATTICIPITISSQPAASQTSCTPSSSTSFTVLSSGSTPVKYTWQYSNNGNWANVSNGTPTGATYSNSNTQTMSVSGITNATTHQYRCNLSNCNASNTASSNIAALIVNLSPPIPTITQVGNTLVSDAPTGNQWFCSSTGYLSGAVGNTYNPTQTDSYYVIVTVNNCEAPYRSNLINFIYTGVADDILNLNHINVFPNPFTDNTNISYSLTSSENVLVSVVDITGKEITKLVDKKQEKGEYTAILESSKISNGIYFIKIKIGNNLKTLKLVHY